MPLPKSIPPPIVKFRKQKSRITQKNNFFQDFPSKISYMTQPGTYRSHNLPNVGILW